MKTTIKTAAAGGALITACAACCAVSIVPTIALGTGLVAIGGAAVAWGGAALLLAVLVVGIYYINLRSRSKTTAAPTTSSVVAGGCGPSCGGDEKVIACSLDAGDFKARTKSIRELAERSLLSSHRGPLTLSLTYSAGALDEVRDLVAKERECCPFLEFQLSKDHDGVHLGITAPRDAADAADILFAHFAPDAARRNLKEIA